MIHCTHLGFLGLITSSFMFINTMELDLNKTIEQYPLISFNADQLSILKNINDHHVPECILQCKTEEEIYTYITTQYNNTYEAIKNIIKPKDIDNKIQKLKKIEQIEQIEKEYIEKKYNEQEYFSPIQEGPNIRWPNQEWITEAVLINKEKLPIVYQIAEFLGINPNCFIIVYALNVPNLILRVDDSKYFIINLNRDTIYGLENNPQTCLHVPLHEFSHLKKGDGEIDGALCNLPLLQEKDRDTLAFWREARADIESVLYPNENTFFSKQAKEKIYLSALLLSLQCDYQTNLWRIGLFLRLLYCNGTPLEFTNKTYSLFGYSIFKNK